MAKELNEAIIGAIEKLNRTDGEGMSMAELLFRAAESDRLIKDCDWCGDMMLRGSRFCSKGCVEASTSHNK